MPTGSLTPASLPKRPLSPSAETSSSSYSRPRLQSPVACSSARHVLSLPPSLAQPPPSPTAFQQPTPLTTYSMHAPEPSADGPLVRRQTFDDSGLALLRSPLPAPGADLAVGYESATWRAAGPGEGAVREGVDGLVEALRDLEQRVGQRVVQEGKEGIITWVRCFRCKEEGRPPDLSTSQRGIVTKLLTAPYDDREGWE